MKNTKRLAQVIASVVTAAMVISAMPMAASAESCPEGTHDYKEATCTEPKTCTVCGDTEGAALGHTYREATCTEPMTCIVCGTSSGTSLGHSFGNPVWSWNYDYSGATAVFTCTRNGCNETFGPVSATISYTTDYYRPNVREYTAEVNVGGVRYTDTRTMGGDTHVHNYVWRETTAATTYSTGVRTQVCTICGKYGSSETIPMKTYYYYDYPYYSSYWYPYYYTSYYYSPYYFYYNSKVRTYSYYDYYYYYPGRYYYYGWRMPDVYKVAETASAPAVKDVELSAVSSGSDISLSWNKITGAESYTVYVAKEGGEYIELATTKARGLRYTGLTNNNTYKFIVKYTKDGELCGDEYDGRAYAKVYYKPSVVIKSDKKCLHLSWGKVKGAEKYAVYKIVDGKAKLVNETTCSAVRMTGLASKTEYSYLVRAYVDGEWTPMMKSDIVTARTK